LDSRRATTSSLFLASADPGQCVRGTKSRSEHVSLGGRRKDTRGRTRSRAYAGSGEVRTLILHYGGEHVGTQGMPGRSRVRYADRYDAGFGARWASGAGRAAPEEHCIGKRWPDTHWNTRGSANSWAEPGTWRWSRSTPLRKKRIDCLNFVTCDGRIASFYHLGSCSKAAAVSCCAE
jgi:hypothetical protein